MIQSPRLPPAAAAKLASLELTAETAASIAAGTVNRIRELRRAMAMNTSGPNMEAWGVELTTLERARAEQAGRQSALVGLVGGVRHWLQSLASRSVEIEVAPPVILPEEDRGPPGDAIARLRAEVAKAQREHRDVSAAALPREQVKRLAREHVAALAQSFRAGVSVEKSGALRVGFRLENAIGGMRPDHVFGMMAWFDPEAAARRLEAEIDAQPEAPLALPDDDKRRRLTELAARLDDLERTEEALIVAAHDAGYVAVLRRPTASPAAVLGVRIVRREAAAA
jgi:hypothetical protein